MVFTDALLHHHFNILSLGFHTYETYNEDNPYEEIDSKQKRIIVGYFLDVIISGVALVENMIHMLGRDFYSDSRSRRHKITFDEDEIFILNGFKTQKPYQCKHIGEICPRKNQKHPYEMKVEEILRTLPKLIYKKTKHEKDYEKALSDMKINMYIENFLPYRILRNAIIHGGFDKEIWKFYNEDLLNKKEYYDSLKKRFAYYIQVEESYLSNGLKQIITISEFKLSGLSEIAFNCSVSCVELIIAIYALIDNVYNPINTFINLDKSEWNYIDFARDYSNKLPKTYIDMIRAKYSGHERIFTLNNL